MATIVNDRVEHARAEQRAQFCATAGLPAPKRRHKCLNCFSKFYALPQVNPGDPGVTCDGCRSDNVVVFD